MLTNSKITVTNPTPHTAKQVHEYDWQPDDLSSPVTHSVKESEYFVCRGGRTGTKNHISITGSSVLGCGTWVKYNTTHFQTSQPVTCDKCKEVAKRLNIPTA